MLVTYESVWLHCFQITLSTSNPRQTYQCLPVSVLSQAFHRDLSTDFFFKLFLSAPVTFGQLTCSFGQAEIVKSENGFPYVQLFLSEFPLSPPFVGQHWPVICTARKVLWFLPRPVARCALKLCSQHRLSPDSFLGFREFWLRITPRDPWSQTMYASTSRLEGRRYMRL